MSILLRPYVGTDEQVWDTFVAASGNGTVFHTRRFLSYHTENRFEDHSLLFFESEKLMGVLSAAKKDGKLASHPGASYGGIVVRSDTSVTDMGAMLEALLSYAKQEKFTGISMLRLPPASLQKQYAEDQHYWLYQQGYELTRVEMDGAIDLTKIKPDGVPESFTGKCRNMVRQAERAKVEVRLTDDFDAFWPVLEGVLEGRHGTKPTHTLTEIKALHSLLPESFRLLAAYQDKKMIGGIVLITLHDQALYTLYMAQEYAAQKDHPMHMLLAEAIKLGLKEKRRVLHLGVSTEDGGKKVNEGLFFFKESFGCKPVRRESWELTF